MELQLPNITQHNTSSNNKDATKQSGYMRVSDRKNELLKRYNSIEMLTVKMGSSSQAIRCADVRDCFMGDYPTLHMLDYTYGKFMGAKWLSEHLFNLSEYTGCKDKLNAMQLKELAIVISTEFGWLKITELMLFCFRFKAGLYGRFYGSVDPMVITTALRQFVSDRNAFYGREYAKLEQSAKDKEQRKCMSYDEYCKLTNKTPQTFEGFVKRADSDNDIPQSVLLDNAKSIVDNTYNMDAEHLLLMERHFYKKTGMTPADYIATTQKGNNVKRD